MLSFLIHYKFIVNSYLVNSQNSFPDHVLMLQKERDQILNATVEDIHALAPLIQAVLSDDQLCVVGSENAIEKAKDVFMETKPLVSC